MLFWVNNDRQSKISDFIIPPRLKTASEVAMLEFLRFELGMFSWSDSNNDPVGCDYSIIGKAPGTPSEYCVA